MNFTHICTSVDDYVMIMEEALKLVASKMNISEDQVLAEWELHVRHIILTLSAKKMVATLFYPLILYVLGQAKAIGTDFDCVDFDKPSTSPPQSGIS